jgi:diguanylate cyclase (GGDEF)-like protein
MKYVILLTEAHEPPSIALLEALREAKVEARIEGLREAEVAVAHIEPQSAQQPPSEADDLPMPLAVLYEVSSGAEVVEIYAAIEQAVTAWPTTPLVACRRHNAAHARHHLPTPDSATLKRAGFRAVADEPAQLPALLREMEDHGSTGEFLAPPKVESEHRTGGLLLPLRLRAEALREAFDLVASLHFAQDQKSAAHTALAGLSPLINADRWTIYLTTESNDATASPLEPFAVRGLTATEQKISEDDWRHALLSDAGMLAGAESKAAREAAVKSETFRSKEQGRRILAVPLVCGERLLGVLEGVREDAPAARFFTKAEAALAGALALPIACALANSVRVAEAERLSQTDDLTKLHNARFLRQFLLSEVKRARRYNSSVTVLFLDLDDFKGINDVHGHLVGSHVLMEMASVLLASVRDTDIVARYGGDEFVIVLPETDLEQAAIVAERMREKIARRIFTGGRGMRLSLTASFGVGTFPQNAHSPQQLIACADAAMYEAKAAHKNCVRFSNAAPPITTDEKLIS